MATLDLSLRKTALIVWIAVTPAYALFRIRWPWSKAGTPTERVHTAVAGQKIRAVKLLHANPADLIPALETFLKGSHSDGYVLPDTGSNGLIITDVPENLDRLEILVHAMDHSDDNPSARTRQVNAMRAMQWAIHTMPAGQFAMGSANEAAASYKSGTTPSGQPAVASFHAATAGGLPSIYIPPKEDTSEYGRMLNEERPVLRAFELVGWFRDEEGVIVVLRNSGQRYIYRRGHLLQGSLSSKNYVKGIHGSIRGDQLILEDVDQGMVTLSMVPEHGHYERIR